MDLSVSGISAAGQPNYDNNVGLNSVQAKSENTIFAAKKPQENDEHEKAINNIVSSVLDKLKLKDNFIVPSVIEKDGKYYLRLTRLKDDKLRPQERSSFDMRAIKRKLGIKDNVINANNDLKDVTGRSLYENSNSGVMEPGKSIDIPLEELGQTVAYFPDFLAPFIFKSLRADVNAYLTL